MKKSFKEMIKNKFILLITLLILFLIITTCLSFSQDSYCSKCGARVNSGDIYCSKCGAKLSSSSSSGSSDYSTSNLLSSNNWSKADLAYYDANKAGENWVKLDNNYVKVYHKGMGSRVMTAQTVSVSDITKLKFSCTLEAKTQGIGIAFLVGGNNGVAAYLIIDYLDSDKEKAGSSIIYVSNGQMSLEGYTGKRDTGHIFDNTPTQHIIEEYVTDDWNSLNKLNKKTYKINFNDEINTCLPELHAEDINYVRVALGCTSNAEALAELIVRDIKLYYK